jgi:hypothetical protein
MRQAVRPDVAVPAVPGAAFCAMLIALGCLSACGDNRPDQPAAPRPSLLSERVVAVTEMPDLYRCLSDLGQALRKQAGRGQASLACAAGTYRGQTSAGRPCELRIDGENGLFRFQLEGETVEIKLERAVHAADGAPIHNLEDASAPAQPGIQLTRFTGAFVPVTEALILRFGGALPSLPQMIYQRSAAGPPQSILCRFGT